MGYEFDFDEELDTAAFKSIDELLTEGSLARKGSITEESISDEKFERKMSPEEDNESDIYSADADPIDSVELEERTSENIPDNKKTNDMPKETVSISPTEIAIDVEGPDCYLDKRNKLFKILEDTIHYDSFPKYRIHSVEKVQLINELRLLMLEKFPTHNDFLSFINNTGKKEFIAVRVFLFLHIVYTLENPEKYLYYLDYDELNSSHMAGSVYSDVEYIGKLIRKL